MTQRIETARRRIELAIDDNIDHVEREKFRMTAQHHEALVVLMDELHRLHVAVSAQAKTIASHESIVSRYTKRNRKAPDARSQPPAARSTTPKTNKRTSPNPRRSEGE